MTDDDCICGHSLDQHEETFGYCEARGCRCVVYRTAEELEDDGDFDSELDFDHGA